ncbi:MAG: DUF1361 domain-containing protein [Cyanobacteria bacterium CRU_2_1]|nr:DUF1361 domain-containing protein [Cyanobacteria bacterium RU_5_0]NJR60775.1 DUF1361 domain-containing protein [Cyanobacteria bacterium CRU_2_1]
MEILRAILSDVRSALANVYSGWILWNLFLAFIPLLLSFWLYRGRTHSRNFLWWVGFIVFIAFLPNAPYVLTDIIHLIRGTRFSETWVVALVFIPIHISAILLGFEAYVVSLINQAIYLKRQGARQFVFWSELLTHALCAIGIYLGRFRRFNSWDFVTEPENVLRSTIDDLTSKLPLLVIVSTFVILAVFYWVVKQITIGLILRWRYYRLNKDVLDEIA